MHTDNIYRPTSPHHSPSSIQSCPSNPSSSYSSSPFALRAGLGALAATVEHAITRWTKRRGTSTSSSSTSSHSSKRSSRSCGRSFSQSEKNFVAHITLVKARKEAQQVPRQFTLYLPSLHDKHCSGDTESFMVTDSLPVILDRLELALEKSFRAQREQEIFQGTYTKALGANFATSSLHGESASRLASGFSHNKIKKGKARSISLPPIGRVGTVVDLRSKAWYVDVASPSWEDLRALGNLLHLHPLTLEDILENESREKVEIFSGLGYYLISFRAIEAKSSRDRTRQQDNHESLPIGGANVYLAVFKHGICTFHFTDTSAHTRRVLNRMKQLNEVFNLSSDWITYEMLDSIVDSFFPYLEEIEKEVLAIEKLLFSRDSQSSREDMMSTPTLAMGAGKDEGIAEKFTEIPSKGHDDDDVGTPHENFEFKINTLTRLSFMDPPQSNLWRSLRRLASHLRITSEDSLIQNSKATLRHICMTRRLVTSLSRLLATKHDVVTQIRKRLLINSQLEMSSGISRDSPDIAMYMGDMQDHIYTLQHSLAHYERMLSQLHPTYLSQLRTDVELTKDGKGKGIVYLSVITVAMLCIQSYIGIFSMNVSLPHNTRDPTGTYHVFGFVLATSVMILIACCSLVWYWQEQAKLRRTNL